MKKTNVLLLSLVSLCMIGCKDNSSNTNKTNSNNNSQVSTSKTSTKPSTVSNKTDNSNKKTDSTIKTDSDIKTDSNSTSSSDIYDKTNWPLDIAKVMYRRLDERFVPYIDLKASNNKFLMCSWSKTNSTLSIISNYQGSLTDTMVNDAKTAYEKEGWTTTITNDDSTHNQNVFEATNADKDLTVKFFVDDEVLTLNIKFDEKFDESKANGTWDDELLENMNPLMDDHGNDIPYIYLGTINPSGGADTYTPEIYAIDGGKWDDKILSIAKKAFDDANASISTEANKWTYEDGYYSSVTAKRTLSDGCKLEIKIYLTTDINGDDAAKMEVLYKGAFKPSSMTSWSTEISDVFKTNFDNHQIPYFYIGSDTVTKEVSSYDKNSATFYSKAYTWDDKIYDLALTAINEDNKNYTDDYEWKIEDTENDLYGTRQLVFTKDYDDGCNLTFTLDHYEYDDNAQIKVKYRPKYSVPAGAKWPDKAVEVMNEQLGEVLPYVHLGNLTDEAVFWNEDTTTLTILGDNFYYSLLNGAKNTFTSDLGWNGGIVDADDYGTKYKCFIAEKTNPITGAKMTLSVDGTLHLPYYENNIGGYAVLKVVLDKPYVVPKEEKANWENHNFTNAWDSEDNIDSTFISNNLDGHTLPYVYLNSKEIKTYFSKSSNLLSLTGGKWDDKVLDHAKSQFESATGWSDVTKDDTNKTVTAKFTAADGCKLTATVFKNSSEKIELQVEVTFGFVTITDWSDEIKNAFTSSLNGYSLPLVQVGSKNPELNTYVGGLSISNNNWKEGLLEETQVTLNAEGWKNFINKKTSDDEYDVLNSYKEFDDGIVYFTLSNSTFGLYLQANFFEKPSSQTKTDWKDSEKTFINNVSNNNSSLIPFLYMGDDEYTTSTIDNTIKGSEVNTYSIIKYYETLQTLGYKDISLTVSTSSFNLSAYYTDDKGNKIELSISNSYDSSTLSPVTSMTITYTETTSEQA